MKPGRFAEGYMLLAFLLLLLSVTGYTGYALYPRFDLPLVSGAGLLLLAGVAGIASFFSPCSFPLLVTLLAREIRAGKAERGAVSRAAIFGFALSTGASLFLLLTGGGIALGAGAVFETITFTSTEGRLLRIVVGCLLIILGLVQWQVLALPFDRLAMLTQPIQKQQIKLRREHPAAAFGLFGFGYILAGFG